MQILNWGFLFFFFAKIIFWVPQFCSFLMGCSAVTFMFRNTQNYYTRVLEFYLLCLRILLLSVKRSALNVTTLFAVSTVMLYDWWKDFFLYKWIILLSWNIITITNIVIKLTCPSATASLSLKVYITVIEEWKETWYDRLREHGYVIHGLL